MPATVKRTLLDVLQKIESDHAGDIESAILEGIRSGPRTSAGFIKLVFEYRLGKPPEKIELESKPPLIFLTQKPLGDDPLADKAPPVRGTSEVEDAATEAADNQMRLKAVRPIVAPGDPDIAEDEGSTDMLDGLVEMTLNLPHERGPYT